MAVVPAERTSPGPVATVEFQFSSPTDGYGFVNVGAKICDVVPGSLAGSLGVLPGWYLAQIDGEELPGAMSGMCRRPPQVTTDDVKARLKARRAEAFSGDAVKPVRLTFWTNPSQRVQEALQEEPMEASSVDALKFILVQKYGSVVAAWNEVLDTDGSGQLSYKEFLDACRVVGFTGKLRHVYDELDKDGSGVISLTELDPTCAMDFTQGRCAVCTLPNPCKLHREEAQKRHTVNMRKTLESGGIVVDTSLD